LGQGLLGWLVRELKFFYQYFLFVKLYILVENFIKHILFFAGLLAKFKEAKT